MTRRSARRAIQTELRFPKRGGARPGAGRKPKGPHAMLPHRTRERLSGREPVLVTMKVRRGI